VPIKLEEGSQLKLEIAEQDTNLLTIEGKRSIEKRGMEEKLLRKYAPGKAIIRKKKAKDRANW